MKPTIGRTVVYHTTQEDQNFFRRIGNSQDHLPAVIVAVWGDSEESCVNLKVIGDGPNDLWVTSRNQGTEPGQWSWPEIKK